jgi:hypothetical protein
VRGGQWLGLGLLSCALAVSPSCVSFPGGAAPLPFDAGTTVQEGELTLRDGQELFIGYPKVFAAPPRLVIVEFRQSWFKDRPYSKSDFVFVRQDATGFRVVNNHPEVGRGMATIKWRAEGVLAAQQPVPPPPPKLAQMGKATQEQIVAAVQGLGGIVTFDMVTRITPRPVAGVDLHHTKVTDADLESLRALTRLRSLSLSGTGVTDAGLKAVGEMATLQTLLLNETHVGDTGLQHLQRLTELRELSLYHTRVSDDGLASLKGLTNLRDLTLSGPQITDRGLAQLSGLRNLRHLYLSKTGVSKAGVQELKKALPKVEIIQ